MDEITTLVLQMKQSQLFQLGVVTYRANFLYSMPR